MKAEYANPAIYDHLYRVMQRANVIAMRVSVETGMRIDDVLSLRPDNVNGSKLTFTAKKTGKNGVARISADLARELRGIAGTDWVFPGRDARKHRTRQTVYRDIRRACAILGVETHISPHSARKTFAVELRKEKGLAEVQKALQHANAEVTKLYAFADIATPRAADGIDIEALAQLIAEKVVFLLQKQQK